MNFRYSYTPVLLNFTKILINGNGYKFNYCVYYNRRKCNG